MLQPGAQFGQLAVCVLGVLLITSEYSTGMIKATMLAEPRRTPALLSKAATFAALIFVISEIVAVPTFFIGAAITHAHASVSIANATSIRAILAFGLYMSAMGIIALSVGTLVKHTAAGISAGAGAAVRAARRAEPDPGQRRPAPVGRDAAGRERDRQQRTQREQRLLAGSGRADPG